MCLAKTWASGSERARLYIASVILQLAFAVLRMGQALFYRGFMDIGGVKCVVGLSEKLRRLGWYLARLRPSKRKR
jgi:hypothetical protein